MRKSIPPAVGASLQQGVAIPASPLVLNANRCWDQRRQRALWRYYIAAGAGGIAVGVHTTQFAIRDPKIGLLQPLLELACEEFDRADETIETPLIRVAGICGRTQQAVAEAAMARDHGFHAGLLSLAAMSGATEDALIDHCHAVAEVIPVFGFYLQPAVGGIPLPYSFWRRLLEIPEVVAIKVAAFNRYQTIDVVRAVAESERQDVALYTGNDDNIVIDLLTPYRFQLQGKVVQRRFVGGLLGHWACWTQRAVQLLDACHAAVDAGTPLEQQWLGRNIETTDANAVLFDAANNYAGCIPGIHEVLRRQGLIEGTWCLDPAEVLSPGQTAEIDRAYRMYPHLNDDSFVAAHRDQWLA